GIVRQVQDGQVRQVQNTLGESTHDRVLRRFNCLHLCAVSLDFDPLHRTVQCRREGVRDRRPGLPGEEFTARRVDVRRGWRPTEHANLNVERHAAIGGCVQHERDIANNYGDRVCHGPTACTDECGAINRSGRDKAGGVNRHDRVCGTRPGCCYSVHRVTICVDPCGRKLLCLTFKSHRVSGDCYRYRGTDLRNCDGCCIRERSARRDDLCGSVANCCNQSSPVDAYN